MKQGKQLFIQFLDFCGFFGVLLFTVRIRSISSLLIFERSFVFSFYSHSLEVYGSAACIYIFTLYITGQYEDQLKLSAVNLIFSGILNSIIVFFWLLIIPYLFSLESHPRSFVSTFLFFNFTLFILIRVTAGIIGSRVTYNVLVVGSPALLGEVLKKLRTFRDFPIHIKGAVVANEKPIPPKVYVYPVLGTFNKIDDLVKENNIDIVIIYEHSYASKQSIIDQVGFASYRRARFFIVPDNYEIILSSPEYLRVHDFPLIRINKVNHFLLPVKRICDIVLALFLIVICAPFLLITAAAVKLTSPGPAIFTQMRVGLYEKLFKIYKFRTMYTDFESRVYKAKRGKDRRLTPVGRFLRMTRLDELPQLFNILRGDMSFIGPRPLVENEVKEGLKKVHGYRERFAVYPGVTGLAQVHGDYYTQPDIKIKYDLWYVHHYSLLLDFKIILRTMQTVLLRRGS